MKAPTRDPRFDDLSGTYNEDSFRKAYGFVDEHKDNEMKAALLEMKKTQDEDRRADLMKLVQRMKEQKAAQKEKDDRRASKSKRTKAERALVASGKKPFFLKKSDEKTLELVDKFNKARLTLALGSVWGFKEFVPCLGLGVKGVPAAPRCDLDVMNECASCGKHVPLCHASSPLPAAGWPMDRR